ncbi:MAG: CCA tRNA nucleotidyltransferase, partial [Candidatus Sungbacteria bacterium]|nr:CCA tRNA nucleotidyltransferase [Candidatus Sungbacteria bacterium]
YVGGLKDIKERVLRPVGDPEKRFAEDYSRMLRYVRFRNQCELPFDRKVQDVIKRNAEKIMSTAPEKVRKELDAMLQLQKNYLAIADMERLGLLQYVLPELSALRGVIHPRSAPYHKEGSVFRHTLEALRSFGSNPFVWRMREMLSLSEDADPGDVRDKFFKRYGAEVPWAVLCHDLGKRTKQQTRTLPNGESRTTFVGHELDSRDMVRDIAKRFNFSAERRDKIMWLVENHLIPRDFPKIKVSKSRAFLQHQWIEELLFVSLADSMGSIPVRAEHLNRPFEMLHEERNRPPELKELVSGKILMEELELNPGKAIGRIKDAIREAQLEGHIKTAEEALEFAREYKKDMKEDVPGERRKK